MAVATRPARRASPVRRRRYLNVGAGGRAADLAAVIEASRPGSAAPGRGGREERGGRRPRREAPAPAVPARFEVPAEEPVEATAGSAADADELLVFEFVAGIVEDLPDEELPETRAEIEEEVEDLARLAETLRTPLFATVQTSLLARARGVIAQRQQAVADLAHERRYEDEDDELGEEVAPGLFETTDGRLVDEDGNEYRDVDDEPTALGPVLIDEAGNRYSLDDEEGLIPLANPEPEPESERDKQGRFGRESVDAAAAESAETQQEAEPEEAEPESESPEEPE